MKDILISKVNGKSSTFPTSGLLSNCFPLLNMVDNKCPYYEDWTHCAKNRKGIVTVKRRWKPHDKYSNKIILILIQILVSIWYAL